jgi:hypothetical protein
MNDRVEIRFRRLRPHEDDDIPLPQYMTPGAAGMPISDFRLSQIYQRISLSIV